MDYPHTRAVASALRVAPTSVSTNTDLLVLGQDPATPTLTVLLTLDQTAGRGRLDRSWVAPAGTALALSVFVRDALASPAASWLPLVAGLTLAEALDAVVPGRVAVKWPNDLLLDELKVCGILVEVARNGRDVVIGSGLNLAQTAEQLPVPTATSLALAGVPLEADELDRLIADYVARLRNELARPGPTPRLRERVVARCSTIGRRVRVALADGGVLEGVATGIDPVGRLEVASESGEVVALSVGDVTHVRPS